MKAVYKIIFMFLVVCCFSCKSVFKEVITYHKLNKEDRKIYGNIIEEKYKVDKKTKLKHGLYEKYALDFMVIEQGQYENGIKSGVWRIWNKEDEIFIEKDFANNGLETPLIFKKYLRFPMQFVEKRDTIPHGIINMKLEFDNECKLTNLEILKGIDQEFDKVILNEYKIYTILCNKYNTPIKECKEKQAFLKLEFTDK